MLPGGFRSCLAFDKAPAKISPKNRGLSGAGGRTFTID
jgi:hypothetical protein